MDYTSDLGYIEVGAIIDDHGDEIYIESISLDDAEVTAKEVSELPIGGCRHTLEVIFDRVKDDVERNIDDIREYWNQYEADFEADLSRRFKKEDEAENKTT